MGIKHSLPLLPPQSSPHRQGDPTGSQTLSHCKQQRWSFSIPTPKSLSLRVVEGDKGSTEQLSRQGREYGLGKLGKATGPPHLPNTKHEGHAAPLREPLRTQSQGPGQGICKAQVTPRAQLCPAEHQPSLSYTSLHFP